MSDDSDFENVTVFQKGKRKVRVVQDSETSSSEADSPVENLNRRRRVPKVTSDSEEESSSESEIIFRRKSKKIRVVSDVSNDSSSSDESSGSYESERESENARKLTNVTGNSPGDWSDSSDGQSEKCPICLLKFKLQEVGSPETCDHSFCFECIQEWSRNVNTCPVDRQEFSLILVRQEINGRVVRRVPVEQKKDEETAVYDLTYCEVCGQSDREDRMLLCDGCDLGYHLECLDPPLDNVPIDEWYCSECSNAGPLADTVDIYEGEVDGLLEEMEEMGAPLAPRPRRLLPRTRQSERVRTNIETRRGQANNGPSTSRMSSQPSTSSGLESTIDSSNPNTSSVRHRSSVRQNSTKRKRKRNRKRTRNGVIEYELDDASGAKFALKMKVKKRKRRSKRKRIRRTVRPKTVKKRLANHLGIGPVKVGQQMPDGISFERSQAGIPTLHLFGRRDELDYFSDNDDNSSYIENVYGPSLITRARPAAAVSIRAQTRLKTLCLPSPPAATTPCDILDSILDSQSKFLSKDAKLSLDQNGTVLVQNSNTPIATIKTDNEINLIGGDVDIQSAGHGKISQTPMYPGYGSGGNRPPYSFNNRGSSSYRGSGNYGGSSNNSQYGNSNFYGNNSGRGRGGFTSQSYDSRDNRTGYMEFLHRAPPHQRGAPPFQRGRGAPRFPLRRMPQSNQGNDVQNNYRTNQYEMQQNQELDLSASVQENEISRSTEPNPDSNCALPNQEMYEDEELDIYSDIETNKQDNEFSTNEVGSSAPTLVPPPIPPVLPGIVFGSDSDEKDSDTDLVIDDTEKTEVENPDNYDPAEPSADTDSEPDTSFAKPVGDSAVASTSDVCVISTNKMIGPQLPEDMKQLLEENTNNDTAVSVVQPRIVHLQPRSRSHHSEDSEDEQAACPNIMIYSAQSTSVSTDLENRSEEQLAHKRNVDESDEDCPNFSIYSAESMDVAKVIDDTLPASLSTEAESSDVAQEKPEQSDSNNLSGDIHLIEPDSVQNAEVESSTNDFESKSPLESFQKHDTTDTIQQEPDSVENQNEPDSNNMEKCEQEQEQEQPVNSETFNSNECVFESENENQSEEISTTQKEIGQKSADTLLTAKKAPIKIDIKLKNDLDRKPSSSMRILQLYDDSDFEEWSEGGKDSKGNKSDGEDSNALNLNSKVSETNNVMAEIEKLTEAVSEEERCYTPCLDEKKDKSSDDSKHDEEKRELGIGGLDTEMVSEDEKNDFDESQEVKTVSDGEALEINAKDHELDLTARPEDYEEGEIVEGKKKTAVVSDPNVKAVELSDGNEDKDKEKEKESKKKKAASFKKVSKNNKERNYRDKERERSKSKEKKLNKEVKEKDNKKNKKEGKKKEKKKELERYDVRNIIGQRAMKDKFGRDEVRERSPSKDRRTPPLRLRRPLSWDRSSSRSLSRGRRSITPRRRKSLSRSPHSRTRSRSRRSVSRGRKRSISHAKHSLSRRRSLSRRSLSRQRSLTRRSFSRSRSFSRERRNKRSSLSRSRSYSPYRPKSRSKRSRSHIKSRRKSRSRSPRNKSNTRHRKSRTKSKERPPRKDKNKKKSKKKKSVSPTQRNRLSLSASPTSRNIDNPEWDRTRYRRDWTPSWSRSPSPRIQRSVPNIPATWTPPVHYTDTNLPQSPKLTVYLRNNDALRKKKDKKKKGEKRNKDSTANKFKKRRRTERTPPPSKEVFASGDNILVSVSFNKNNETDARTPPIREVVSGKRKRDSLENGESNKKSKKDKSKEKSKKGEKKKSKKKDVSNIKPVAIIDLDKSPFKELTPSPRDVIVLSDSENGEKEAELMERQEMLREELLEMGSQEQDSAPQSPTDNNYMNSTGPKTPPEPQIKFLIQKPTQLIRNVQNPLHDDQDDAPEEDMDPQEELELRLNEVMHKGPNTPPEPPSSPPSSPDVYDPFEPTKSRSPSPEPPSQNQINIPIKPTPDIAESESSLVDLAVGPLESSQKTNTTLNSTTEARSSPMQRVLSILNSKRVNDSPEHLTRSPTPITSVLTSEQDSQTRTSPEKVIESNPVVINRTIQTAPPPAIVKPMVSTQTHDNRSSNPTMITSTPIVQSVAASRQSLFNTTSSNIRNTPTVTIPQRIVLPTTTKSSPTKLSPLKASTSKGPIKSTPIKPMQSKTIISKLPLPTTKSYVPSRQVKKNTAQKQNNRNENGVEVIEVDLDFESPYSPGSSDFEDLFEPPMIENTKINSTRNNNGQQNKNTKSPAKPPASAFDSLFGSSPIYKPSTITNKKKSSTAMKVPVKYDKKQRGSGKQIGVKLDEDSLKILDDLPSSAVELQVKDKFLKKLNRQERVVEEVKFVLKPHYNKKHVTKEQYKDILRRAVPKICHNKSGEINPKKIQNLIDAYVKKARAANRKLAANSANTANSNTQNQQKPAKSTFWS